MKTELERLLCAIPKGKENAVHNEELANQFGVSIGVIKKQIQEAREQEIPIVSAKDGYWQTDDREELQDFINSMEKQGKKRLKTIKALKRTLKGIEGQESLFNVSQDVETAGKNE